MPRPYMANDDFFAMTFSGSGDLTVPIQPVDLVLPPTPQPSSTSACEAADFAGFAPGNIALIQRGTCTFEVKAQNAQAARAAGVILFNEGNPDRTEPLNGTLGRPFMIPVVGTSFAIGQDLSDPAGTVVRLRTDTISEPRLTVNVHADLAGRDPANIVQVGAHLDSVIEGPGINDNGSGSAAILGVARMMRKAKPVNTVRFSWWGAEELGLLGSEFYVNDSAERNPTELARIKAYLNVDMVGSPNFMRFIYDGDQSTFPPDPNGVLSQKVRQRLRTSSRSSTSIAAWPSKTLRSTAKATTRSLPSPASPPAACSPALRASRPPNRRPSTGEPPEPPTTRAITRPCDALDNLNLEVLDQNADAIAHATFTFAIAATLPPETAAPQGAAPS
jgi:hypothetical protein